MHNPIDSRQLSNFCELVKMRTMRKAAKNLNLTTSAVSYSIKNLESDLGCKLFQRDSHGLELTHAGRRLYSISDDLLTSLTKTRYLVHEWGEVSQKTLRIGATSAACQYIIPMVLRELKESFPGMNIQITVGTSYKLMEEIEENNADVAIFPWGKAGKKNLTSIGKDSLEFIVNPLHPWASNSRNLLETIESQRIILPDSKGYTFDLVNEYFNSYRKKLMPFIEISNEEVIKRLVELDIGIGILPDWILKDEKEKGSVVSIPIGRKQIKRNWVVSHSENRELSFAETLFIGVASNVAQSLFSDMLQ